MRLKFINLFILCIIVSSLEASALDISPKGVDRSCHEFKELMTSGNKLMFLRSDAGRNNSTWKAVICLQCNREKESSLIRVTSLENGAIDWQFKDKSFLALEEIVSNDDDSKKEIQSMYTILNDVKKTCKAYLEPVNEGSHLRLTGREACVRHEYLRQYLKRKYSLNENSYLELELKKDLAPNEFANSCRQFMQVANERSVIGKSFADIVVTVKKFLGIGLGEYDPVVTQDSKSFYREIANETPLK